MSSREYGGRNGRNRGAGGWRRLAVERLDRIGRAAADLLGRIWRGLDVGLRRLDDRAVALRDGFLRSVGLQAGDISAESIVGRAPVWLRRPIEAVGRFPAWVETRLESLLGLSAHDPAWRRAASGVALLLLATTAVSVAVPPEARPGPVGYRPLVVGYFENGWNDVYNDSFPTLQRYAEEIDVVMPFWYSVRPDGSIEDRGTRPDVTSFAHASGIRVVPLFNNAKTGVSAAFLVDPAARAEAAAEISGLVDRYGYDGVHLDFELLPADWKDELTSFVRELRAALGPSRQVSIAVFPKVGVSSDLSGVYDYAALASICDFIVIMGYDQHYAGGPPGPVSPYDWIEKNIAYALDQGIPPAKVVLAVGGYGYDWPAGGMATDIPSRLALDYAQSHGAVIQWDAGSQNPYFTYYQGRNRHEVWYQDERVMAQRIEQVRHYGLHGLALWRLGYETPATWSVIRGAIGPRPAGG